jgi:hypothetical protein
MARFNELLVGRFNRAVQKLFSMKGPASLVQLAGELQATHLFFSGAENRYLEGWDRFAINVAQTALAANNAALRLRNPTGSNVIAVLEKITVFNGNAGGIAITIDQGPAIADLTTAIVLGTTRWDSRGRLASTLIASKQNGAAGLGLNLNKYGAQILPTTTLDVITTDIQEFPLLPGDSMQMVLTTLNNQLDVSFWWRERFLEDSERA